LSPNLHYHSINHTKDVTEAVERIALKEGITDEGLFLLKSAATYHDAGFAEQYDKNEEIGMRMAREILPKYGYSQEQIDVIDGLIKSTEIPQSPNTLLEQIMCDADLDYLGRDDFHDIASLLRRELREHGKIDSDRMWDEIQVKFLTEHTYFTKSSINSRRDKKMKHLEEIKEKLKTYKYKD
jgi:predicted metal-dependent HD superfamily phosphohydrolase